MPPPHSLLVPPLSRQTRIPQQTWFWPQPADQSVPDQPPLQQYRFRKGGFWQLLNRVVLYPTPADPAQSVPDQPPLQQYRFRKGGFWQLLNRVVLYPTPADQSVPDAPTLRPYIFRAGGFWQPQQLLLQPPAADQSVPDAPTLKAYVFRRGGFWQIQKFAAWPQLTDAVVVITPPPPPPIPTALPHGGERGHVISDTWVRPQWRPPWTWLLPEKDYEPTLVALLGAGAINEEEFLALLAALKES